MNTLNIKSGSLLVIAMIISGIQPLSAEEESHFFDLNGSIQVSSGISLGDIVDIASQRAPEYGLQTSISNYADALQQRSRGLLAESPGVGLDYQFDDFNNNQGFRETEVGIELPLWRPKQKQAYRELAEMTTQQASQYPTNVRLLAAGRVREVVWELNEYRADLLIAEQALKSAQTLENKIRRLVELGEQPKTDLLLASQNSLNAMQVVTEAKSRERQAEMHYHHLTGLTEVPETIIESVSDQDLAETHPALASSQQQINQARARADLLRSAGNGQPSLRINTRREAGLDGAEDQNSIGIGISLPLGGRKYFNADTAAAEQAAAQAKTEYKLLHHELLDTLTRARVEYASIQEASRLTADKLALADQQLKLSTRAYEVGEMDFIDLLRMQSAYFEAQKNNTQLQTRLGRTIATINQALGITP